MTFFEFLNMGGYAIYVWSAYGITAVVLIGNAIVPLMRHRRQRESLSASAQDEPSAHG